MNNKLYYHYGSNSPKERKVIENAFRQRGVLNYDAYDYENVEMLYFGVEGYPLAHLDSLSVPLSVLAIVNSDAKELDLGDVKSEYEPFQKVLVAHPLFSWGYAWKLDLYSHYDAATKSHILVSGREVEDGELLPYEGNETKLGQPVKVS